MREISESDRREVMAKYGMSVYDVRLSIASNLYSYGIQVSPERCLELADAFVVALIGSPPVY